jgi:hypothetical protein
MPKGIPVATFAIGAAGAANAALFAVAMLAVERRCPARTADGLPRAPDGRGTRDDAGPEVTCRRVQPRAAPRRCALQATPGRAGRRPARPHVRACRTGPWLSGRGAGARCRQPGRCRGGPAPACARLHRRGSRWLNWPACSAVTTEFENVPAVIPAQLAACARVTPGRRGGDLPAPGPREAVVRRSRCALRAVCPGRFAAAAQAAALASAAAGHPEDRQPGLRRQGAGRGPRRPNWPAAFTALGGVPCVLEKRLPSTGDQRHRRARWDGQWVHLPVQQNLHRDGILAVTQVPAPDVPAAGRSRPSRWPAAWPRRCSTWACCVSSSSCWPTAAWWPTRWRRGRTTPATTASTPATCRSSTCRCARWPGLPLVQPRQHSAAVMLNLLGDLWFDPGRDRAARTPDWPAVLACRARTCTCTARPNRAGAQDGPPHRHRGQPGCGAVGGPAGSRAAGPAGLLSRTPGPRMPIVDGHDPAALQHAANNWPPASWWPLPPKPSTAWAPAPTTKPRWPASSPPRAAPPTTR